MYTCGSFRPLGCDLRAWDDSDDEDGELAFGFVPGEECDVMDGWMGVIRWEGTVSIAFPLVRL